MKRWRWLGILVPLLLVALWVGSFALRYKRDQQRFPLLVKEAQSAHATLFRGISYYPGSGEKLLENRDILVKGEKIHEIAAGGTLRIAKGVEIKGEGMTLLPGFVDAHVHLSSSGSAPWSFVFGRAEHNLQGYLRAGVTTVFELGGMASASKALRESIEQGHLIGPRLYFTDSPVTARGGHPIPLGKRLAPWPINHLVARMIHQLDKPEEAKGMITTLRGKGVDYVKIIIDKLPPSAPRLSEEIVRALVAEAKRHKLKVFAHVGSSEEAVIAARAGVDVLAHGVYRGSISDAQAQEIARSGCKLIYTLYGFVVTEKLARAVYQPSPLERIITPDFLLTSLQGVEGKRFAKTPVLSDFVEVLKASKKHWKDNVQRLVRAGVPFLVGTDSALPAVYPGSSFHHELEILNATGLSPALLLEAATSRAAEFIDPKASFGRIAVGKRADLVLVRGNPLQSIRHASAIEGVWRDGKRLIFHR